MSTKTCTTPCNQCSKQKTCRYPFKDETWPLGKVVDLILDAKERLQRNEIDEETARSIQNGAISLADPEQIAHIESTINQHPLNPTEAELFRLKKRVLEGELE